MPKPARILVCRCAHAEVVAADVLERVSAGLRGVSCDIVTDLCGLAGRRAPELKRIAAADTVRIVACKPRAVKWMFHAAKAPLTGRDVELLDMTEQTADEILASLMAVAPEAEAAGFERDGNGWIPWFPVIDYDRCTGCRQCLNFCLFGTYAVSGDGEIEARSPEKCKTNCPACARVCPEIAVIFPKHKASPINGAEITAADEAVEPVSVDTAKLASGDIYDKLRRRGKSAAGRFSTDPESREPSDKQKQVLADLQEKLGIPSEVLKSIGAKPSHNCDCPCGGLGIDGVCDCECEQACDCPCHAAGPSAAGANEETPENA